MKTQTSAVIPAQAGIQVSYYAAFLLITLAEAKFIGWMPACAGMTINDLPKKKNLESEFSINLLNTKKPPLVLTL